MTTKDLTPDQLRTYYILLGIMIITGAANTIFLKLQNDSYAYILDAPFNHPWFQSIQMFIGEAYCAIFWFIWRNKIRKEEDEEKIANNEPLDDRPDPPPYIFLFTCMCDVVGSTLLNFALLNMASSIFQMLRGGIIIITCIFTILFLKKAPKNYHWLGVFLVFFGVFLVGLSSIEGAHADPLGIILLLVSLVFSGLQFVFQEIFMVKYRTAPMQLVAWEGMWGLGIFVVLLTIFEFIPCGTSMEKLCSMNENGDYFVENTIFTLKQMADKPVLYVYAIGQTISIGCFNFFGIQIVNYSSSATRAVMDSTRTILVWVFFLFVAVNGVTEPWSSLELCGFVILLIGQLIYNGLITVNFANMDYHYNNKILGIKEAPPAEDKNDDNASESAPSEKLLKTQDHISTISNQESKV